jgi:hypothetical protein
MSVYVGIDVHRKRSQVAVVNAPPRRDRLDAGAAARDRSSADPGARDRFGARHAGPLEGCGTAASKFRAFSPASAHSKPGSKETSRARSRRCRTEGGRVCRRPQGHAG